MILFIRTGGERERGREEKNNNREEGVTKKKREKKREGGREGERGYTFKRIPSMSP